MLVSQLACVWLLNILFNLIFAACGGRNFWKSERKSEGVSKRHRLLSRIRGGQILINTLQWLEGLDLTLLYSMSAINSRYQPKFMVFVTCISLILAIFV